MEEEQMFFNGNISWAGMLEILRFISSFFQEGDI